MLLQRLATGAIGVKQARYRRGPTRGSEALYAHAQYNTQPVAIEGPWHLLSMHGVMPAYEFRRGFCTLVLSSILYLRKLLAASLRNIAFVVGRNKSALKFQNHDTLYIPKVIPQHT